MAKTKEESSYSEDQAVEDGWQIALEQEPEAISAKGTGAAVDITVREGRFIAEKTIDGGMITAAGHSKEALLEAIAAQQASLDSALDPAPGLDPVNDHAGDADGDENVGLAGVLPETAVDKGEEEK